jgi:hypothetical protein
MPCRNHTARYIHVLVATADPLLDDAKKPVFRIRLAAARMANEAVD